MPLVIDANAANQLALAACDSSRIILAWVRTNGRVVSGGRLQRELGKTRLAALLQQWSAAGKLKLLPEKEILTEEIRIRHICSSDDEHVLAVVTISDRRLKLRQHQKLLLQLGRVHHQRNKYV